MRSMRNMRGSALSTSRARIYQTGVSTRPTPVEKASSKSRSNSFAVTPAPREWSHSLAFQPRHACTGREERDPCSGEGSRAACSSPRLPRRPTPPPGPASPLMGTPRSRSDARSRSNVRRLTLSSRASSSEASEAFQRNFVSKQQGILRRILLQDGRGGYADLVFFESEEHFRRVAEAEASSEHCQALFELMVPPDPDLPDTGVLSFNHIKTYE